MIEWTTLLAFVPAALALNFTPGADMLFCLGQGLRSGARSAVAASLGVSAGGMVHVGLAGVGVATLVSANPALFDVIRWGGVGYLLYLAWEALRAEGLAGEPAAPMSVLKAFRTGFLVNITNPKVILFVLAFVPQFVDPERGAVFAQFMTLGVIIAIGGALVNGAVGLFAGRLRNVIAGTGPATRWMSRVTGGIFAGLALRLALLERAA